MPRTCTVCKHKNREVIDAALVAGEAYRNIAKQYETSPTALIRHKADHLPESLTKAKAARDIATADDLLDQLGELADDARRIKAECEKKKDYRAALAGIRELVRIIELLAELRGKLNRNPQVNIVLSAEWLTIRTTILHALAPYPDARQAVAKALTDGNSPN